VYLSLIDGETDGEPHEHRDGATPAVHALGGVR
jgi:hypothetical protein